MLEKIEVMQLTEYKLFECKIGMNYSRVLHFNDCKSKCVQYMMLNIKHLRLYPLTMKFEISKPLMKRSFSLTGIKHRKRTFKKSTHFFQCVKKLQVILFP